MKILEQPVFPNSIPDSSQWLAGQGAGSWFWIGATSHPNQFQIKRFSANGTLECDRIFECIETGFQYAKQFEFTYLSHCAMVTLKQGKKEFTFRYLNPAKKL